ncbi:Coiled-coil domain-containing protein 47 [Aphelenchoides bicaudatus]|nr:Coiled-coil domain-containing protein 47 [Aphelenchoides bicaudatus]
MRLKLLFLLLISLAISVRCASKDDFSEFDSPEDFGEPVKPVKKPSPSKKIQKEEVIFEEDEFASLADEHDGVVETEEKPPKQQEQKQEPRVKPLTFVDIPNHFRSNWASYQVESVMLLVIFVYALNFIYGKSKNHSLATSWYAYSQPLLEQQFALVGDDGTTQEPVGGQMMKETEYNYLIWSTGRIGCRGMLSQLKLLKRQDLVGVVLNKFQPKTDKVIHKVELDLGEMDTFVFAVGLRKTLVKLVKDYTDLTSYAGEKKNTGQYNLPAPFTVFTEVSETIPAILDQSTCQFIKRYERFIDYFHFSDQYCGQKVPDENLTKLPETTPTLIFSFNVIESEQTAETEQLLLQFVFHIVDRIRRYKLSREGKQKADKNRRQMEESFLKNTHQQRQEAAQARREEKTRERKAKILEEEDPDKQRKLQKIEAKKESKFKQPKVKQLRVK